MAVAAIPIALKIAGSLLAAHTARLTGATNENEAVDQVIPAFDADMHAIADAYNSGTDPQECISALVSLDTNIYTYLHSLVGKAGTAWTAPTTAQIGTGLQPNYSADCNKSCTVSCCIYLNDLRPAIFGRGPSTTPGMVGVILAGGGTVIVPKVYPPSDKAYGNYERDSYNLVLKKPPISIAAQALSVSGLTVTAKPSALAPLTNLIGPLTSTTILAILGVVGGLILVVTALFGQDSLRVNK